MMIQRNRRVAIYTRVSTDGQTCANQEDKLRAVAKPEAVCRPREHKVELTPNRVLAQRVEPRSLIPPLGATDPAIGVNLDDGAALQDLIGFLSEIRLNGRYGSWLCENEI
jgi:hypothetical protein